MTYPYLEFFNLQYWYCVFISFVGQHCTYVQGGGVVVSATTTAATAGSSAHVGFWQWLFGFSNAARSGASATGSGSSLLAPTGILGTTVAFVAAFLGFVWAFYSFFAYLASLLLFLLILASIGGIAYIRMEDDVRYGNLPPATEKKHPLKGRWDALLEGAMSSDPKRWREGILGADALLGELFTALGYEGATTDEQLKKIPDSAFANIPAAWEAHRIRNFISSSYSHFILTQREAFRVMKLYEQVFREFDFI